MKCKDGVTLRGLHWRMRSLLMYASAVYEDLGQELVVTSALDGEHGTYSWHYFGRAFDLRTRYFDDPKEVSVMLGLVLEYVDHRTQVVLEEDHIHVELDSTVSRHEDCACNYCYERGCGQAGEG